MGGVIGNPVGVTSIKDLFYRANGSTETALRDVAAAGYAGVEVFDGNLVEYENCPEELRRILRETGLELVAVYAGANFIYPDVLDDELWRIEKGASLAAGFGPSTSLSAAGQGGRRVRPTTTTRASRTASTG